MTVGRAPAFSPIAVWVVVRRRSAVHRGDRLVPALLVIVLAEGFGWRSFVVYGVLGGALAMALSTGSISPAMSAIPDSFLAREREVFAAAGIAGGLVYWLFAGRKAGFSGSSQLRRRLLAPFRRLPIVRANFDGRSPNFRTIPWPKTALKT